MTEGRRGCRPEDAGGQLRARVHARGQDLVAPPREGHAGGPRGEPAHDRRVRGLPGGPGEARDLRRRALLRRLPGRARLRAPLPARGRGGRRGERDAVRHERLVAAVAGHRGHDAGGGRARRLGPGGHPHARRRGLRRGERARGRGGRRPARAGHDERLRRALRQRQPDLHPAGARPQAGLRVDRARAARPADGDRAPRGRALQRDPEPEPALRGRERLRAQGRHARGGREPRRAHLRARGPGRGGRRPSRAGVRAVRKGHGPGPGRRGRRDRHARDRAREGDGEPRLPVRGGRRVLRPPDPQGDGRVRAAVPARVLARDRREARGRPRGDRGHDQDLGRRRALRAHC